MEYEIKKATIDDLVEIQKLSQMQFENENKQQFDTTLNLEWSFSEDGKEYYEKSIIGNDRCIFVVFVDDQVVGYIEGGISKSGSNRIIPKFAELDYMFVMEEYRGIGLGKNLYETFSDWCKEKGIRRLRTEASAKNVSAINFYRKNGFADYDLILETEI